MKKQLIISIGREFGSAGHEIGKKLAEKLEIPFYDRNLLEEIASIKKVDVDNLTKYDEKPHHGFFSRTVRGYTNSPAVNIAELQFALLKSKAVDEDSFVCCGRCSDQIFKGIAPVISVFIQGDRDVKIKRIREIYNLSEKQAILKMERHDRKRKLYHNHFYPNTWGVSKSYDLVINSSKLGVDATVNLIYDYIKEYQSKEN